MLAYLHQGLKLSARGYQGLKLSARGYHQGSVPWHHDSPRNSPFCPLRPTTPHNPPPPLSSSDRRLWLPWPLEQPRQIAWPAGGRSLSPCPPVISASGPDLLQHMGYIQNMCHIWNGCAAAASTRMRAQVTCGIHNFAGKERHAPAFLVHNGEEEGPVNHQLTRT